MKFLTINNRANFILKEVPIFNPASRKYAKWWEEQTKRCIDGFWSIDEDENDIDIIPEKPDYPKSNQWRYIPPACYFYVNFGHITANKKGSTSGAKVMIRPSLDDVEWEFHYNWIEARGFSGFELDEIYSCNQALLDDFTDDELIQKCLDENEDVIKKLKYNYFKKNGERKEYMPVRQYIRRTFEKPLGKPIYANTPSNMMILATRDGGKSWLSSGAVAHEILFDGLREYVKNQEKPVAEVVVGAAISDKSKDLLKKATYIIDNLPGKYNPGAANEVPSPFYKGMTGSIANGKDLFHLYKKKVGGEMKDVGTGAIIKHRVFTTENPEAAAGGRPGTIVVEEVGLMGNVISVHGGNVAAQNDSGFKFGSSLYIGTAGNVEKILESEVIFNDPSGFDMLEFDNDWEPEHGNKICWFIPATHMARSFKDRNGNTKIAEATRHFEKRRAKSEKSITKKSSEIEKMNYPLVPSEMFVNAEENVFPTKDIKQHYSNVISNKKLLNESYKVEFIIKEDGSIDFKNVKKEPIREFPLTASSKTNMEGCPEIFVLPVRDEMGVVPSSVYIAGYDPIDDDDNSDISRSLQSFWIMNRLSGEFVFEYTGRTELASDFYEQCRRALIFYNAICNYENNKKGFYGHLYNKTSLHLLAATPDILLQKDMQKSRGTGNKSLGTNATGDVIDLGIEYFVRYLVEPLEKGSHKMMLHTIKSPALLRELLSYKPGGNFDRISALLMLFIYRESRRRFTKKTIEKVQTILDDPFFNDDWYNNNVH